MRRAIESQPMAMHCIDCCQSLDQFGQSAEATLKSFFVFIERQISESRVSSRSCERRLIEHIHIPWTIGPWGMGIEPLSDTIFPSRQ